MAELNNLSLDVVGRLEHLEAVKNEVRQEVQAEVKRQAAELAPEEQAQAALVGEHLKKEAILEVVQTEKNLKQVKLVTRALQFVDFGFYVMYWLIGMEFLLELLGAREGNGFRQFIHLVSTPILGPFRRLLFEPGIGPFQLRLSYVAALLVYVLLHWAIKRLVKLVVFNHRVPA
ncbi:MAG: YggT family protein [Blastocatellia bacterium]|nr:YggT family protein [Blastocatellia bacterium]